MVTARSGEAVGCGASKPKVLERQARGHEAPNCKLSERPASEQQKAERHALRAVKNQSYGAPEQQRQGYKASERRSAKAAKRQATDVQARSV